MTKATIKPKRCCYNCEFGGKVAVIQRGSNEHATRFNAKYRFCFNHWKTPFYEMHEKRSCRGFKLSPYMEEYFYDDKENADGN